MKAMTVRQPWAGAIAAGLKTVENRGRRTLWRGPIAIHAARAADRHGLDDERINAAIRAGKLPAPAFGAVIAIADLVDCHFAAFRGLGRYPGEAPKSCCEPWGHAFYPRHVAGAKCWHLVLANVRPLAASVPCRGQRGIPWTLPPDIAAAITANPGEAARG